MDNDDLWKVVDELLRASEPGQVQFTKVKGHAKLWHIRMGLISPEDMFGNQCADRLAVAGAVSHAAPVEVIARARACSQIARSVQSMMLEILAARRARGMGLSDCSLEEQADELAHSEGEAEGVLVSSDSGDDVVLVGGGCVDVDDSSSDGAEFVSATARGLHPHPAVTGVGWGVQR